MKNTPNKIYLQIGVYDNKDTTNDDFNNLCEGCITWSKDKVYKSDIEFTLTLPNIKK